MVKRRGPTFLTRSRFGRILDRGFFLQSARTRWFGSIFFSIILGSLSNDPFALNILGIFRVKPREYAFADEAESRRGSMAMSTPNRCVVAGILLTAVALLTFSSWTLQRQIQEFDQLALRGGGLTAPRGVGSRADDANRTLVYIPDLNEVPDPIVAPRTSTAEQALTLARLQLKIAMHFPKETSLEDVIKYLKTATRDPKADHDLQIYADPIALQEADKTLSSTVTIDLENLPLSTTLGLLLKQLELGYRVDEGGLIHVYALTSDSAPVDTDKALIAQVFRLRCEIAALRGEIAASRPGSEIKAGDPAQTPGATRLPFRNSLVSPSGVFIPMAGSSRGPASMRFQ